MPRIEAPGRRRWHVDDRLKAVGRHAKSGRRKVACRRRDHDVDGAEFLMGAVERGFEGRIIANVQRADGRNAATLDDGSLRQFEFFGPASGQHDLRAVLGETFGNA